jgi:hypothetical protein
MPMGLLQCSTMEAFGSIKLHQCNYLYLAKWITSQTAALRRLSLMEPPALLLRLLALSLMSLQSLAT